MNKDKYVFAQMVEFLDNNKLSYALLSLQDVKQSVKWLHYIGNEVDILTSCSNVSSLGIPDEPIFFHHGIKKIVKIICNSK